MANTILVHSKKYPNHYPVYLAVPKKASSLSQGHGCLGAYLSAVLLTLMNPMLILSFAAIFAGLDLVSQNPDFNSALAIVIGVFCGSAIWWIFLSGIIGALSMKFNDVLLLKINHFSGILIGCFGLGILGSAIFMK